LNRAAVVLCGLLLASRPLSISAQQKPLSAKAQKLTQALLRLQKTPNDPQVQEQYLETFPHDYKSFLQLFDLDRDLYDGYEFVTVLSSLANRHELEVGKLLVQLSKDAHYEADALSYLQHTTATYGGQHTKTFLRLLKLLPARKQANLITFLADVEDHSAYHEYQIIIDQSRALGETEFATKFEVARTKRSKQPHG
jgi:hypothetical protein